MGLRLASGFLRKGLGMDHEGCMCKYLAVLRAWERLCQASHHHLLNSHCRCCVENRARNWFSREAIPFLFSKRLLRLRIYLREVHCLRDCQFPLANVRTISILQLASR